MKSNKLSQEDIDKLVEAALSSNTTTLANYFRLVDNIKSYSPNNIALINGQTNGQATIVKSYNDWKKDGVQVQKGEKALKIWIPTKVNAVVDKNGVFINFKSRLSPVEQVKFDNGIYQEQSINKWTLKGVLFDIKQTNAIETDYITSIKPNDNLHSKLLNIADSYGIKVEYSSTNSKTNGGTVLGFATIRDTKLINLDINLDENNMNKVLLHEVAHLKLEHLTTRSNISLEQKEFEAEAVAHLVASKYGIQNDNMSNAYLKNYYNEEKFNIENVTEHILNLSNELLIDIDNQLAIQGNENTNNTMTLAEFIEEGQSTDLDSLDYIDTYAEVIKFNGKEDDLTTMIDNIDNKFQKEIEETLKPLQVLAEEKTGKSGLQFEADNSFKGTYCNFELGTIDMKNYLDDIMKSYITTEMDYQDCVELLEVVYLYSEQVGMNVQNELLSFAELHYYVLEDTMFDLINGTTEYLNLNLEFDTDSFSESYGEIFKMYSDIVMTRLYEEYIEDLDLTQVYFYDENNISIYGDYKYIDIENTVCLANVDWNNLSKYNEQTIGDIKSQLQWFEEEYEVDHSLEINLIEAATKQVQKQNVTLEI